MKQPHHNKQQKSFRKLFWMLLLLWALILAFLILKSCEENPALQPVVIEKDTALVRTPSLLTSPDTTPETTAVMEEPPIEQVIEPKKNLQDSNEGKYKLLLSEKSKKETALIDSLYVYADPWGGRHFDSVSVSLFCREDCIILYGFEDSLKLKSYDGPFTIARNTKLWLAGVNEKGEQSIPIKIAYTIEKESGECPDNMLPVTGASTICMDTYEWPNVKGGVPQAYVNQQEASDSCEAVGKRLCTVEEWRTACGGLKYSRYPYGNQYNENYCPAKERAAKRSGRYPACRSYFGQYDLTGNLWEWTSTPASQREGFFMVAGGNWDGGNQATCSETKYSFYPQNKYLFVGFRCCQDPNP